MDLPTWLLDAAKAAGVFGALIMTLLWWRADTERRAIQARMDGMLEKYITSTATLADTTKAVAENVKGAQETLRGQNDLLKEMASTMRSLVRRGGK